MTTSITVVLASDPVDPTAIVAAAKAFVATISPRPSSASYVDPAGSVNLLPPPTLAQAVGEVDAALAAVESSADGSVTISAAEWAAIKAAAADLDTAQAAVNPPPVAAGAVPASSGTPAVAQAQPVPSPNSPAIPVDPPVTTADGHPVAL